MSYKNYGVDIKLFLKSKKFKNQTELFPKGPFARFLGNLGLKIPEDNWKNQVNLVIIFAVK